MYSVTFTLEALTPVFMRGANPNKVEIRAPSIKGVVRWWFRALAGKHFGENIAGLKEAEKEIFGSTEERSKVLFEVEEKEKEETILRRTDLSIYQRYFWFSQIGNRDKKAARKLKIKVRLASYEKDYLRLALYSLWASVYLGGFGSRMRRFAGSFVVVDQRPRNIEGGVFKEFGINFLIHSAQNIRTYYRTQLSNIVSGTSQILKELGYKEGEVKGIPKYPIFSDEFASVFIGKGKMSVEQVIEEVGRWYLGEMSRMKFVGGVRFKYANRRLLYEIWKKKQTPHEKRPYLGLSIPDEKRPYLGLPIQFYKRTRMGKKVREITFSLSHPKSSRRASPLLFTVKEHKRGNRSIKYPVITFFRYLFLPQFNGFLTYSGKIREGEVKREKGGKERIEWKSERRIEDGIQIDRDYARFYEEILNCLKKNFEEVYPCTK